MKKSTYAYLQMVYIVIQNVVPINILCFRNMVNGNIIKCYDRYYQKIFMNYVNAIYLSLEK